MIKSKKIRLYPTKEQEVLLWKSVGTMRFIYNWTLDKQQTNHKNGGKFISDNNLRKQLTQLKKNELSWLREQSSQTINQAVKDACNAYKSFFKGLSKFPKFKSRRRSKPSFYVRYDRLSPSDNSINFEKIGRIRIKPNQLPLDTKYSNPRCSFDGKYWYLSVGIECDENQVELNPDLSIGVDLGVKDLAVLSNGKVYKNINKSKEMKRLYKKLKRLQRQLSRKYEMNKDGKKFIKTKNIIKLEREIKLVHRRITNIRQNHNHHLTSDIIKQLPYRVVIEDLNVSGMMKNRHLSKAISRQGFYEIRRQLEYKCKWNGVQLVIADRFFPSSKICSDCGFKKVDLKLSDRIYKCSDCKLIIDRDYNASLNLANYTLT